MSSIEQLRKQSPFSVVLIQQCGVKVPPLTAGWLATVVKQSPAERLYDDVLNIGSFEIFPKEFRTQRSANLAMFSAE